ncbi:MAG: type IIL restriction-modification enzyme MmeI [Polyangiales bacterium]
MRRQPLSHQQRLAELAPNGRIADLTAFLAAVLDWTPDLFDVAPALPDDLSLYVPEGHQTLRPSLALKHLAAPDASTASTTDDSTPASRAGSAYVALVWDLPPGLPLDKPETVTGAWEYPPAAKFDRLLRACRVPIGVLTNRDVVRLVYAPHGESSGHITFRVDDMASVAGRSIFDAFVMLLSAERFFGVSPEHQLSALLRDSRSRQANVTNELAEQMLDALHVLLAGFVGAAERDGSTLLDDALSRDDDHVYKGLLTVLLRLVFALYAEDRGLLPIEHPAYDKNLSVLGLFEQLQRDHGEWPDSMARRFGAWPRLVTLFRAVFLGVEHGDLVMPARRGELFDPHRFAFLEGWGPAGAAPLFDHDAMSRVRVPTVDDETVFRVLERLLVFQGQRLSYRALDVEQIGAVYEALMGYHVVRLTGPSVCLKGAKVWVAASEVLAQAPAQRTAWVTETAALAKSAVAKLAEALKAAKTEAEVLAALDPLRVKGSATGRAGQLVIQPGAERRRTSSHYTPPSLTAPIVRRTLEPLLAAMGETPSSERLLDLKVCDPAMGSGAFLVEACRFLADQVVAAWTREARLDLVASAHGDVVLHARRLVAQRCLYGVDKNPLAVSLARLSLWLVTLAKDEPFTFVDHALRHGDSLVGLDVEQIRAFHWKPGAQLEFARELIDTALTEALESRQRILSLAAKDDTRAKEHLLWDANDALAPVRLIGDLIVGAFFAHDKDKAREAERKRRLDLVVKWLESRREPPEELVEMQRALRERVPAFHWWVEFPEVFYGERPDPLDGGKANEKAWMDAFVGNPPFMGGRQISGILGNSYLEWLLFTHSNTHGNGDLVAHFLRRSALLLGGNGTLGIVGTKTMAEGDTRAGGLEPLLKCGFNIFAAETALPWPGEAAVSVSVVHLALGTTSSHTGRATLNGHWANGINSALQDAPERLPPARLSANESYISKGSQIYGNGFVLSPEDRSRLLLKDERNSQRIFPFVGGEDITTTPEQQFVRYVISFHDMDLRTAATWPDLLDVVERQVRPEREKLRDDNASARVLKQQWWRFQAHRPSLYAAISCLKYCFAISEVTKHAAFVRQPTDRIFAHTLQVIALSSDTVFAILQSRLHESWARNRGSTLGGTLRYAGTDCFSTFPFPQPDPRAVIPALEEIGERLYTARAAYMVDTQQGLTQTYNQLKDPRVRDARVVELRRLHEEMDRAVLAAYGWDDLAVPPYGTPTSDAEKKALERFEDGVINRLFALNVKRSEEERAAAKREAATKPAKAKGARKKKGDGGGQGDLGIG